MRAQLAAHYRTGRFGTSRYSFERGAGIAFFHAATRRSYLEAPVTLSIADCAAALMSVRMDVASPAASPVLDGAVDPAVRDGWSMSVIWAKIEENPAGRPHLALALWQQGGRHSFSMAPNERKETVKEDLPVPRGSILVASSMASWLAFSAVADSAVCVRVPNGNQSQGRHTRPRHHAREAHRDEVVLLRVSVDRS